MAGIYNTLMIVKKLYIYIYAKRELHLLVLVNINYAVIKILLSIYQVLGPKLGDHLMTDLRPTPDII